MIEEIGLVRTVLGWLLIGGGGVFFVIGAIGLIRLPDVFTRLHAVSVGDTFGAALILVGLMVVSGFTLVTVKLIFLVLLLWFFGPIATHAVARAALQSGLKPVLSDPAGEEETSPSKR